VKPLEALYVFDRVDPLPELAEYGELAAAPVCCNVSVRLNSTDGVSKLSCCVCGLTLTEIAGQWIITDWGTRGIRLRKPEALGLPKVEVS
jgi:hypothetical protein